MRQSLAFKAHDKGREVGWTIQARGNSRETIAQNQRDIAGRAFGQRGLWCKTSPKIGASDIGISRASLGRDNAMREAMRVQGLYNARLIQAREHRITGARVIIGECQGLIGGLRASALPERDAGLGDPT